MEWNLALRLKHCLTSISIHFQYMTNKWQSNNTVVAANVFLKKGKNLAVALINHIISKVI